MREDMIENSTDIPIWETDPDFLNPYTCVVADNEVLKDCDNWNNVEGYCTDENGFGEIYEVVADCGNWIIDIFGNIAHKIQCYEISYNRLKENDWILHLSEKSWFTFDEYLSFKCAYRIACGIAGVLPVQQITHYSNEKPTVYRQTRNRSTDEQSKTYLMHDSNTGYTKIGKSVNPRQRERTLQSEKPTITMFAICDRLVEKELHNKYADKRIRGEWFDLTSNDIENIKMEYNFKDCVNHVFGKELVEG